MLGYSGITVLSFANKVVKVQPQKFVRFLYGVPKDATIFLSLFIYVDEVVGIPGQPKWDWDHLWLPQRLACCGCGIASFDWDIHPWASMTVLLERGLLRIKRASVDESFHHGSHGADF